MPHTQNEPVLHQISALLGTTAAFNVGPKPTLSTFAEVPEPQAAALSRAMVTHLDSLGSWKYPDMNRGLLCRAQVRFQVTGNRA